MRGDVIYGRSLEKDKWQSKRVQTRSDFDELTPIPIHTICNGIQVYTLHSFSISLGLFFKM